MLPPHHVPYAPDMHVSLRVGGISLQLAGHGGV
jgi:hypothetical protein